MSETPTSPRIDPRTLADALDYREAMKESGDIASKMLQTFKGLSDILAATTRLTTDMAVNFDKMKEMSKEVLSNTKIRARIDQQIYSNIESSEARIAELEFKKIRYEKDKANIQKDAEKARLKFNEEEAAYQHTSIEAQKKINRANADADVARAILSAAVTDIEKSAANDLLATILKEKREAEERLGLAEKTRDISKQTADVKKEEAENGMIFYGEQIAAEKKLIEENEKASIEIKKQQGFMSHLKDSSQGSLRNIVNMASKGKDLLGSFKKIPGPFIILQLLLESSLELFKKLDKAAEDFRKQTGFSNTQMAELRKTVESINRKYQQYGVSIENAYASARALTDVFGRTSLVTEEAAGYVALLSANLGVAVEDSANVLANFQGLGKATETAAMNVITVGAGISEKAGVPFKLVMNDIANASEQTTALLGSNPSKLMKSAIAARALGTSMNSIVSSQRKLLDFSSSINDELEASALLGKSISFQKARQLAYDGDIAGAAKATLAAINKAGDFNKMNVYQREALAKASGMELKDLNKMMAVEAKRNAILNGNDESKKAILKAQDAELEALKEKASLDDEDLVKQNKKAIMQQKMQGLVSQLGNMWDSILLAIGSVLEPIIRVVAFILVPAFKMVGALVEGLFAPFRDLYDEISNIVGEGDGFKECMEQVAIELEQYVYPAFKFIGVVISTLIVGALKLVGGLIGVIVGTIANMMDKANNIGDAITLGIESAKEVTYNAIIYPFIKAWDWLMNTFMGNSPSELGLAIVKGIKSIGSMLLDVLLWPYKKVWNFVTGLFSGDGDIAESIISGMKAIGGMLLDAITFPFRTAFNFISSIFGGDGSLGDTIVGGIKSAFGTAFEFVTSAFSYVVDSIKNVASDIFGFITSPFKKAMEFVKSIPLFGNLFGGNDIGAAAKPQVDNSTIENSSIIEVKNLDALRDVVQELTNAVANLATAAPAAAGATTTMNTSGIEAKLDTLTNLLTGGAVRVYLDGKDVSSAMSGIGR
jgi:plasmid stability protein/plasmid maintenance system antidote protein VapI